MAESTLSIGRPELLAEVGDLLDLGRTSTDWSATDLARVEAIIKAGLRRFYIPRAQLAGPVIHHWSFLQPVATITTTAADWEYDAPDDFGGLVVDQFTFSAASSYAPIKGLVPLEHLLNMKAQSNDSGTPHLAALRVKAHTGAAGQRYEFVFYPIPDAIYTLSYQYRVNPNALSASYPYPKGGMVHAETIMEACKAAAEDYLGDTMGIHHSLFQDMLQTSIEFDRSLEPTNLGNYGPHDEPVEIDRNNVTFEGVEY